MILERILSCVSMRENVVWCMALAAVLAACNGKRAASEVDYAADSVFESSFGPSDSFNASSASLDEELPKRADELFDDFIFEFARLKKVRLERVEFPLLSVVRGDTVWLTEEQWKYESLFMDQDYYTVFYNDEEQMDLEKRTDLDKVDVEQIHLEKRWVKTCRFQRLKGEWRLTQESIRDFTAAEPLDKFMDFYRRFVSDAAFQKRSVSNPLRYVTTDPDDDFNTIEGTLDHDQWDAFKPQLPDGVITNIRYGQTYDNPDGMILVKAGISNGLMDILDFRQKDGEWKLVSYEN